MWKTIYKCDKIVADEVTIQDVLLNNYRMGVRMYYNLHGLLNLAKEQEVPLWKVILENEMKLSQMTEEEVFANLSRRYKVMVASSHKAMNQKLHIEGSLINGLAYSQNQYAKQGDTLSGEWLNHVMALALSSSEVNVGMGRVCAAPTAGSCGILPAVLIGMKEAKNLSEREVLQGLLTASGVGAVVMKNATVAGAEGGCQAECGVAAAMAAAAAVEMSGGSAQMALHAFSLVLINVMGLVCDPIAGLVQVPCAQRNASQAVNAIICADMAMAGMKCIVPADEVVEAMYRVGKQLPYELKETGLGGLAATPTAKTIRERIFGRE
ncbi:L-serine ammonia-lyase, iron-sulfur-dependent, subunit alpha [Anaerosporobacter sp.]|uniref:L-serine ammonia-lyase, iron-sulfur-dependent, subunit alpha n=1 Tax=Anaerosporobacter sp. TaxID=1872529 RepID=UPI00286F06D7|nr:L-serine ammonia-lyase, iron-sulfur-dependent, subunit alpha [Anaerosporobacter sp.]